MIEEIIKSFKKLDKPKLKSEIDEILKGATQYEKDKFNNSYMINKVKEFEYYHHNYPVLIKAFYNGYIHFSSYTFISKLYRHYAIVLYVLNRELPRLFRLKQTIFNNFGEKLDIQNLDKAIGNEIEIMIEFLNKHTSKKDTIFIDPTFKKSSYQEQIRTAEAIEELLKMPNGLYKLTE